jgi:hypothetical protein
MLASLRKHLIFARRSIRALVVGTAIIVLGSTAYAIFNDGGFESATTGLAPSGWTVNTFLNQNGFIVANSETLADLQLATGGTAQTIVVAGTSANAVADPNLGISGTLRYPRYGLKSAVVNQNITNRNVNVMSQTIMLGDTDVDPLDGQLHIRFTYAPVLQNPNHAFSEQPYYFIQATNLTQGNTVIYSYFGVSNQPGIPWKSVMGGTTQERDYLDWQLVDIASGSSAMNKGDRIQLQILASGCSLASHGGYVYVDGVGPVLPGINMQASGPATTVAGLDATYNLTLRNGNSVQENLVVTTFNTPPNTTFQSLSGANDASCSTPAVGATGAITCTYSVLGPGATAQPAAVTVNVNSGTATPVVAGNYTVTSSQETVLVGPPVTTALVTPTVSAVGPVYNRGTRLYSAVVTVKNTGTSAITGPIDVVFNGLPSGVTLSNAAGTTASGPYLALASPLAAGASASVTAQFSNPSNVQIPLSLSYTSVNP